MPATLELYAHPEPTYRCACCGVELASEGLYYIGCDPENGVAERDFTIHRQFALPEPEYIIFVE
jgi:hypothetical protein